MKQGKKSEYDSLTGVYTREAFCFHAEQLLKKNPDVVYNIVMSDFVNFKHFNARYGSEAGDLLLKRTGEMLTFFDPEIVCGRYSADRFVTMMRHVDDNYIKPLEEFRLPEQAKDELPTTNIVVKFGVCSNVDHGLPAAVLCDRAYLALQSVKHQYGKNVGIYDEVLGEKIRQEIFIEENMQNALDSHQFQVYYQPKMNTETGKICGAEALIRWIHPVLGFMNPGNFIPMFEKNGFITDMDIYVWEEVCKNISEWQEKGLNIVPVSTNVSRKDFDKPDISSVITQIVDKYNIDHKLFHIEVTESICADDPEKITNDIYELHKRGFIIELDDFGSGYTSLSSLNDMTFDILKIDMSILRKDNPNSDRSVLKFAMQLANMMNMKTIQEGVETNEQLERVKSLGCNCIQGYYFSKPLSKNEFEIFLQKN